MSNARDMKEGRNPVWTVEASHGRRFRSHATPQKLGLIAVEPQITVLRRHRSVFGLGSPRPLNPLIRRPSSRIRRSRKIADRSYQRFNVSLRVFCSNLLAFKSKTTKTNSDVLLVQEISAAPFNCCHPPPHSEVSHR